MSVETTVATIGTDVKSFWSKLTGDVAKAKAVWNIISDAQTRSIMVALANQAITTVKDTATAVEASGINLVLDTQVFNDIKALIADAKAGDGVIVADFKAIGVTL